MHRPLFFNGKYLQVLLVLLIISSKIRNNNPNIPLRSEPISMKRQPVVLLLCLLVIILMVGCVRKEDKPSEQTPEQKPEVQLPSPDKMIVSSENWKDQYPLIYQSFLKTAQMEGKSSEDPKLGGQHPTDYIKKYPNIAILYEGTGFGKEYYQARGHYYSLEDVINTARPKPGASCLACKTGEYERLVVTNGSDFYAKDFQETVQGVKTGISCYNCHRNEPGKNIQITSPQFAEGLKKLKSEPESGSSACAQCHVEYYLDANSKQVILPWDKGIEIDEIEAFYDEKNFSDWKHPRTGTPLIKVQHPEFEMNAGSLHQQMGVSCADCHMPVVEENGQNYRSHWAKSPLKTTAESCGSCHGSDTEALIAKVQGIQKDIENKEADVSNLLVKLIKDFADAIQKKKLDENAMNQIRDLHRKAQYRWDFVFVENSTGFHNYKKAAEALNKAKEYAEEALGILANYK